MNSEDNAIQKNYRLVNLGKSPNINLVKTKL
ncbi:Uncharacterised protein [Sphingobacterium daejeonense]|jgi:hypothetical protein|nr:Uncharacterised protein [Sphingobacterium daejeonense]